MKKSISLALTALMALSFVACNEDSHTHTFGDTWAHDNQYHWHNAECCENVEASKAEHDLDSNDFCKVCGVQVNHTHTPNELGDCACGAHVADPDVSTVEKAVALAVSQGDNVSGGIVEHNNGTYVNTTRYEVGEGYTHLLSYYSYNYYWNVSEQWYVAYGEDKVLPLENQDGNVKVMFIESKAEQVNGYAFETLLDYTNSWYGVEEFVSALYEFSKADAEAEVKAENGEYSFTFTHNALNEDGSVLRASGVAVSFTLSDIYTFENVSIAISNEFYNNSFEITQTTGNSVIKEYDPEKLMLPSYTLKNADGEETSEVEATVGTAAKLTISDIPEGYTLDWDKFTATVVDSNNEETTDVSVYVSKYSGEVQITANTAGEYTVTLESAYVTKTLTVTATYPETTEIYAYANWAKTTETSMYLDSAFVFKVKANAYADATATVAITKKPETSTTAAVSQVEDDWKFVADVAGEYELTITSAVAEDVSSTVTVTVNEVPDVSTILNGTYQNQYASDYDNMLITFTYEATTAAGAIEVTYKSTDWYGTTTEQKESLTYTYDAATKAIALTHVSGDEVLFSVTMNADYTLTVKTMGMSQFNLVTYVAPTVYDEVAGEYRHIVGSWGSEDYGRYVFGLNADGTGAFYKQRWDSNRFSWITEEDSVEFTWTCSDSYEIEIKVTSGAVSGFDAEAINESIVWDSATGITCTFNNATCVFELV